MHSYKYSCVQAGSFECSTGTSILSYDWVAQCYCRLLSTDGSRGMRGLRAIADDRTFIWAMIVANQFGVLLSTLLNFQYFSNPWFPISFRLTVSSNDTDNRHGGSVAVHRNHVLVSQKSGWYHKPLSYKRTLFYKHIFPYHQDL